VRWALPKEMAPPPQTSGIFYNRMIHIVADQMAKPTIRKIFVGGLSASTHDGKIFY